MLEREPRRAPQAASSEVSVAAAETKFRLAELFTRAQEVTETQPARAPVAESDVELSPFIRGLLGIDEETFQDEVAALVARNKLSAPGEGKAIWQAGPGERELGPVVAVPDRPPRIFSEEPRTLGPDSSVLVTLAELRELEARGEAFEVVAIYRRDPAQGEERA